MKVFFGLSLTALLLTVCSSPDGTGVAQEEERTNIILIMADDMGYETLKCNGGLSYKTPNLDKMAAQGIRFTNCYSQPLCTPSRVKIMTGKYNYRNYEGFEYLNPKEKTFGNVMKDAGYATCIVGKWQLNGVSGQGTPEEHHQGWDNMDRPKSFGFEEYSLWQITERHKRYANPYIEQNGDVVEGLEDEYGPDVFCNYAMDFMERNQDKPFFLYYPMVLPHSPFVPTPDSDVWKDKDQRYDHDNRYFKDMVEYVDKIAGKIIRHTKKLGIAENTLILFTGDNGTHTNIISKTQVGNYKGGKAKTIDAGTHVPLIALWPGNIKAGSVYEGLIEFSDFYPTFAEIAGKDVKSDGKSFLPLLKGDSYQPREIIFVHYDPIIRPEINKYRNRFVRTGSYKLYQDGKFYHIPTDKLEQRPIPLENISLEVMQMKQRLQLILNQAPEWE